MNIISIRGYAIIKPTDLCSCVYYLEGSGGRKMFLKLPVNR